MPGRVLRLNGLNADLPLEIDHDGGEQIGGRMGPLVVGGAHQDGAEDILSNPRLAAGGKAQSGQVFLRKAQFVVPVGSQDGQQDEADVRAGRLCMNIRGWVAGRSRNTKACSASKPGMP